MNPRIFRAIGLIGSLCVGAISASALPRVPGEISPFKALRLTGESVTVEYKCAVEETGINSLTGEERTLPVTYLIKISGKTGILFSVSDNSKISLWVTERDSAYILYSAIVGKSEEVMGEFNLQIDKDSGALRGRDWLLRRDNVGSSRGKCELLN